tara:strand:- start:2326 stop:2469 length:144 start_codon:yes stop_codon:yes gene_type:complete
MSIKSLVKGLIIFVVFTGFDKYFYLSIRKELQISYLYVSGKESKNEN